MPESRKASPLGVRPAESRFTDGSYAVLYAADDFATCLFEAVIRDSWDGAVDRVVHFSEFQKRVAVDLSFTDVRLVDLRGTCLAAYGAPTDVAHARNHGAARTFARDIYHGFPELDGFVYASRFTHRNCYAIFDRSLFKLAPAGLCIGLDSHPDKNKALDEAGAKVNYSNYT